MSDPVPDIVPLEGRRIKGDRSGPVYVVLDQKLRHIYNGPVYESLYGEDTSKNLKYETFPQAVVDGLPKGPALVEAPSLVKGGNDKTFKYLIDEGQKRRFVDEESFAFFEFDSYAVVDIGSLLKLIPDGPDIDTSNAKTA